MSRTFADTLRSCSISALRFPVLARVVVLRRWCVGTSKSALPHRAGATFLSLEQHDASPHPLQEALEPPNAQVCPAPPLSHLWMTGTTHNTDGTQQSWRDRSAEHASKKPPARMSSIIEAFPTPSLLSSPYAFTSGVRGDVRSVLNAARKRGRRKVSRLIPPTQPRAYFTAGHLPGG